MIITENEILPPVGSIRSEKNGIIIYKELLIFKAYTLGKGKYRKYQGVDCEGNSDNHLTMYLNNQQISICDLCKNQIQCMFNSSEKKHSFEMLDELSELKRESFVKWIEQNRKSYKIETKKPLR